MKKVASKPTNLANSLFAEQQNHPKQCTYKEPATGNLTHKKCNPTTQIQQNTESSTNSPTIPLHQKSQNPDSSQQIRQLLTNSEEETKTCEYEHRESKEEFGWNGQLADYRLEITQYNAQRESQYPIDTQYLKHNKVVTAKLRTHLIRHIFKMYVKFELSRNTLHLAVFYMDLYFSRAHFLKSQLQVVAAAQACLLIAMKFEEIYPPQLGDWIDRRYRQEVLSFEASILKVLDYQLGHYTLQHYISIALWELGIKQEDQKMSLLVDLSLFDLHIRQFKRSEVAKAVVSKFHKTGYQNEKLVLAVKWMIQRNAEAVSWLRQNKYENLLNQSN